MLSAQHVDKKIVFVLPEGRQNYRPIDFICIFHFLTKTSRGNGITEVIMSFSLKYIYEIEGGNNLD